MLLLTSDDSYRLYPPKAAEERRALHTFVPARISLQSEESRRGCGHSSVGTVLAHEALGWIRADINLVLV